MHRLLRQCRRSVRDRTFGRGASATLNAQPPVDNGNYTELADS